MAHLLENIVHRGFCGESVKAVRLKFNNTLDKPLTSFRSFLILTDNG